jgi:hypothetical protein
MIGLLWLLMACDRPSAEERELVGALASWRSGAALLEAGDAPGAREAFREGLDSRPEDPLLMAWEARAAAEAGALDDAIRQSRQVLQRYPTFGEVRYNLAAYLARNGDLESAAAELQVAVSESVRTVRDIRSDPDFQPHLDHPAFGFLPTGALVVSVKPPSSPVFVGSQVELRMGVSGVERPTLVVQAPAIVGPVTLLSVVEDRRTRPAERTMVDLVWTFRVTGAGAVEFGPFEVGTGVEAVAVEAVRLEALAPADREAEPGGPDIFLRTPSDLVGDQADASVRRHEEGLLVRGLPGDTVGLNPKAALRVRYELREQGQPVWQLTHFRAFTALPETVTIVRGGQTLFEGPPGP